MDDPARVRRGETIEHLVDLRRDLGDRARARARDEIGERSALGELHRVPCYTAARIPIVDGDDGRMRELRGELRLAAEAVHRALVARDFGVQHLERDLAVEREIAHAPHGAERSGTEARLHLVVLAGAQRRRASSLSPGPRMAAAMEPLVNMDV
jgi:hypothetical protein